MRASNLNESDTRQIATLKEYLKGLWMDAMPLAKVFKTNSGYYLYDTGTNKILGCDESIFHFLENIFSMGIDKGMDTHTADFGLKATLFAAETIKGKIDQEKILLTKKAGNFCLSDHFLGYREKIDSSLEILTLEVSETCNIRCDYCVYNNHVEGMRNHGSKKMSLEVAYKAIDYLKAHSYKSSQIAITMYGGEPLCDFPFVKAVTEYAGRTINGKEVEFSITTNATLLTEEIARFLHEYKFAVSVSIDGPREIHDEYRLDANGKGSYERAIQGVKTLVDVYGDLAKEKISLCMVYTPPFSASRLDRIASLWNELPWLPRDKKLHITYPSPGTIRKKENKTYPSEDKDLLQWSSEHFRAAYSGESTSNPVADAVIETSLALLHQRHIFNDTFDKYYLNGCCLPGVKKILVLADGTLQVCEKVDSDAPRIGHVDTGINLDVIKSVYIDGYVEISAEPCSKCWANRLCTACYIDALKSGCLDQETKLENCILKKEEQEKMLSFYCSLLEMKADGLDYLYDYQLT